MFRRCRPQAFQHVDTVEHLHTYPEDDDRGIAVAQAHAPCRIAQQPGEHEQRTDEPDHAHKQGHRAVVADEPSVIAEHQQQVARPEHRHHLHEDHDAGVARHGSGGNLLLVLAEEQPLPPVEEVAAVACAEQVEHHRHRPETESGGQQQILRTADNLARHRVELRLCAEAVGVVHEEEVHRSHPVEHTAEQAKVENLNDTIKLLKEQIDSLNAQIIRLDSNLKDKDAIIELLKERR